MAGAVDIPTVRTPSPSFYNTVRISAVVDRLLAHATGGSRSDNNEICRLCVSLSRGIDYAVGNNEIPDRALELPNLLKQVCQRTNDPALQTAIMVLMISIKGACRNGWFSVKDNEELHILWNEISPSFCSVRDMNSRESTVHQSISTVLSRFYPRMKMGEILAYIEAMPGYGAFVKDFHIMKNAKPPDEIYLFVAQTDNTDTSSCITSPQLVNFLLNGKAVDGRNYLYKDPGPQIPSLVTNLVKPGTNLLQAVGQFNGNYIIVVAFMSMISNPSCPALPDYVPPVTTASDPDNDIVEGPSRISLNCPISFKRITTPVKGHLCKHLQCFDFENYADINSRRPSWRCPHCGQSVCFTDIRIDRGMAKVLKEVSGTISHVKIYADGSWEAVNECDDHAVKPDKSHQKPTLASEKDADIMDLTEADNDNDARNSHQENEKKPSLNQLQHQPNPSAQIPSHVNMNHFHTHVLPHMENRFSRPTHENGTSGPRSNVTISQGQTVISGSNNMQLPTHAIRTSNTVMNPILAGQGQTQISASSMQFQQPNMNSMNNGYGLRYSTPSRHVTRIPIAGQAHPVQTPAGMVSGNTQQQFSRFQMDQPQMMSMNTASMTENMGSQDWAHHNFSNVSSQPIQQFGAHSGPSHQSNGHHLNAYRQQSVNHTLPNLVQSPFVGPTSGQVSNQQNINMPPFGAAHHNVGPMTGSISNQQTHHYANAAAPQGFQISSWTPPIPAPVQSSFSSMPMISSEEQRGPGQAFRTQEGPANAPAEQNWRPTGRMRGSLSGQAYSDAYSRSIVNPAQPIQAASPPVLNTPRPFIPPHLQVLMANHIIANGFEDSAHGLVLDGSGGAGVLP